MTQGMGTTPKTLHRTWMQGPGRPQMRQWRVIDRIPPAHRLVEGGASCMRGLVEAGRQRDGLVDRRAGQEALM